MPSSHFVWTIFYAFSFQTYTCDVQWIDYYIEIIYFLNINTYEVVCRYPYSCPYFLTLTLLLLCDHEDLHMATYIANTEKNGLLLRFCHNNLNMLKLESLMTCVNIFMLNKLAKFISRGCQKLNIYI